MHTLRCAGSVLFLLLAASAAKLTAATADDLITLAKSGVDEDVVKAYIENSTTPFTLTSTDIVTLKDLGVSPRLIVEALKHDQPNDSTWIADSLSMHPESTAVQPAPAVSAVTAPAPDDQNISYFYSALYPYGNWVEVDGNWCWQPNATILDPDWVPYCNRGHWVMTDCGWTWASGYTWGWAPFHYGRWFRRANYGWLWLPDNNWGPAWVAWRTGVDYCGWAPLPPRARYVPNQGLFFGATLATSDVVLGLSISDFTFIPLEHFYDRHPFAHVVPSSQAGDIYQRTAFEKNSFLFVNNRPFNRGVMLGNVERAARTRIFPLTLTEEHLRPGEPIQSTSISENKLIMFRPSISKAAPLSPLAVKDRFAKKSGFGQVITPRTNPKSWQALQNSQRNAAEEAAKNQRAIAETAQLEQKRLDQQAAKETNRSKLVELKGEEAVQAMRAQQAQQHAQRAQSWKPSQEILVPKVPQSVERPAVSPQPAPAENKSLAGQMGTMSRVNPSTPQYRNQVRELSSEAQVEQQHNETVESGVREQAQLKWQEQHQPPVHQEQPPHKGEGSERQKQH